MLKKFSLQEGNEIRGLRIRLYPDADTKEKLKILAEDCRRAWNWLVSQTETVLEARRALAVREGLVGPRPQRPEYVGLSPEDAKRTKEKYIQVCIAWHQAVHKATKDRPECSLRKMKEQQEHFRCKYDYQLMKRVIGWKYQDDSEPRSIEPGAHLLQSLVKNYFTKGGRRKKFRKSSDTMPLQVRSGQCLELGDFGSRGKNHHNNGVQADICNLRKQTAPEMAAERNYYNCRVTVNGLKILGRLPGRAPWGRVLEGVSLIEEADGWWASIKQEVPVRVPPTAVPGSVIGIDVGLDNIVAMSDGKRVENPRGKAYAERIAGRQAEKKPVGRLHLAMARHTKHLIYNEIIKPLAEIETIKIEKLVGDIGQRGSVKTSAMRQVAFLLKERYGDRVQEVAPHYTSQDCSRCGHRSKESWSYEHGRYGECPKCGYRADRDVNAARNVAARSAISSQNGVQADICNEAIQLSAKACRPTSATSASATSSARLAAQRRISSQTTACRPTSATSRRTGIGTPRNRSQTTACRPTSATGQPDVAIVVANNGVQADICNARPPEHQASSGRKQRRAGRHLQRHGSDRGEGLPIPSQTTACRPTSATSGMSQTTACRPTSAMVPFPGSSLESVPSESQTTACRPTSATK